MVMRYSGAMSTAGPADPRPRRNEQHRCTHCNSRFEVWHVADPLEAYVAAEVQCPCCGAPTPVSLPRGAEKDLRVEPLPGTEPETGGGD
jgi:hypothetical protein